MAKPQGISKKFPTNWSRENFPPFPVANCMWTTASWLVSQTKMISIRPLENWPLWSMMPWEVLPYPKCRCWSTINRNFSSTCKPPGTLNFRPLSIFCSLLTSLKRRMSNYLPIPCRRSWSSRWKPTWISRSATRISSWRNRTFEAPGRVFYPPWICPSLGYRSIRKEPMPPSPNRNGNCPATWLSASFCFLKRLSPASK